VKLIWSPQAIQDLNRIAGIIARDKKEAAVRWAKSVETKVSRLRRFPLSGKMVSELGRQEIREMIVGSYRVIYKVGKTISVLTIFHGAKGQPPSI